ncbi:MFS family major facilitator transporter multidrug:cation symporter [Perkinsela sp. CCAP 1560/4]|nr:MFS family major facilitator transporter multidrug:cation symporter [Perkinsela sp. CCAP 1560/4]|eukprot:KNH05900.1 MFS family major facilitator transporter multidrug:cation symporter [Perkinsela sp. CCAP 1560/4]
MLQFHKLPDCHTSPRVLCIALHSSLSKIAVARERCSIEVWEFADGKSLTLANSTDPKKPKCTREKTRYTLAQRTSGIRKVTPCALFWEDLSEKGEGYREVLVVATLSGQFLMYSADELRILTVTENPLKGFFAVSTKAIYLESTMLEGLVGLTSFYAAAMENGFLQVYGGAPHFERFGVGSRHGMASAAFSVCFSPKGQSIFIGDNRGHVQKFDTRALLTSRSDDLPRRPSENYGVAMPVHVYYLPKPAGTRTKQVVALSMCCTIQSPSLVVGTNTGDVFVICLIRNSIAARYNISRTSIRSIACASRNCIIAGGLDGNLVTFTCQPKKGWTVENRACLHSLTCVSSRVDVENPLNFPGYSTEVGANDFLCAAGGMGGEIFCASSFPEMRAALRPAKKNRRFISTCLPFACRSDSYSISAVNDMCLLTAIGKNGLFISKVSRDSSKIEFLSRILTSRYRGDEQFIAMSRNSQYIAMAHQMELRVLYFRWNFDPPRLTPHKLHFTTRPVFSGIQGLTFGYNPSAEWCLFVAAHNAVFSVSMKSGAVTSRFTVHHRICKIIAQQVILCVLCANGEYLIWDESACEVIVATTNYILDTDKENFPIYSKPSPVIHQKITDVCFLHTNPSIDYLDRPKSLVFANSVGEFTIISLEPNTLGNALYDSKEFCQSVYPLHQRCSVYSVACLPVQNPKGLTLRDANILIFSSAHVALFELTRHYENGTRTVRQGEFLEACRAAYMKQTRDTAQLAILPIRNTVAIAPVVDAHNELKILFFRS